MTLPVAADIAFARRASALALTAVLAQAYFSPSLLSTLPSTTMAAWVTAFTGVGPAQHGVTGNEFFIREERRLVAPAPASARRRSRYA